MSSKKQKELVKASGLIGGRARRWREESYESGIKSGTAHIHDLHDKRMKRTGGSCTGGKGPTAI